ncbi:MAG TPA: Mor transcription activator family protein [Candidatus Competibacter sp.]|nr:Mor transcription activator family protein [Candidatus Competibacter sp.]
MPQSDQYPKILSDLADCIRQRLCRNLPADQAENLSLAIAEDIRYQFGGLLIYIPKGEAFDRARRNKAIVAAFDGKNHSTLARRYGLCLSKIYDIVDPANKPEAGRSRKKQDISK